MVVYIVIFGFAVTLMVGFLCLLKDLNLLIEKSDLLIKFHTEFIRLAEGYFKTGKLNDKRYRWLLANVDEVSGTLGGADTMVYRPAFANYVINDYRLLINLIPSFNSQIGPHPNDAANADSILVRYISVLNKQIEKDRKRFINPISWLLEGVSAILSTPIWLLSQFDIFGSGTYDKVRHSYVLRLISGLVSLISTVDLVYSIISGNSFTMEFIKKLI